MPQSHLKRSIQNVVKSAHYAIAAGDTPPRAALIFHELLPRQHRAFGDGIAALKDEGYVPVLPAAYLEDDCGDADDKRLLVSFDDNFKHWAQALPALDDAGVRAVFFITTGPTLSTPSAYDVAGFYARVDHSEDPVPLSRTELLEIRAAGHLIGCHTEWHRSLTSLMPEEWDAEVRQSKERLEDLFAEPIVDFSYPFGVRRHFSEPLAGYVRGLGFKRIYAGQPGRLYDGVSDAMRIPRTRWNLDRPVADNIADIRVDGRLFESLTGRSPVG
ncbi:MAG: polysaccharide deacetylase family protein [Pseudomonadota bacterium]